MAIYLSRGFLISYLSLSPIINYVTYAVNDRKMSENNRGLLFMRLLAIVINTNTLYYIYGLTFTRFSHGSEESIDRIKSQITIRKLTNGKMRIKSKHRKIIQPHNITGDLTTLHNNSTQTKTLNIHIIIKTYSNSL